MTHVKKDTITLINSEEEARGLYVPPPQGVGGKMGLEVEMPLFRPGAVKPELPPPAIVMQMAKELRDKGHDAQLEAAGVIEYASPPVPIADTIKLAAQAKKDIAEFEAKIAEYGYARAPFSIVPTTTREEAMENKISRERLETALSVLSEAYPPDILNIPLLTTGVQTSFSPQSDEEMFRMAYRGYALTPLLVAAMNSSSGFAVNDNARQDIHLRSKWYEHYGVAGGTSPAFLHSSTPEEFIRNHVKEVYDAPMIFAYGTNGEIIRTTKDNVLTFRKLGEMGLNTRTNYELAESFLYNDIKIAGIRDSDGNAIGKRVEIRAADSGLHQPMSVLLLTAALIPDGETASKLDTLLKSYGFTGNPKLDAPLLLAARKEAVEHNGRFMDVPFGTGNLRDFAADVAGLVVAHYERDKSVHADVSTLAEILLTGESDAKRHAAAYKTLPDVTRDLQKTQVSQARKGAMPKPGLAA